MTHKYQEYATVGIATVVSVLMCQRAFYFGMHLNFAKFKCPLFK